VLKAGGYFFNKSLYLSKSLKVFEKKMQEKKTFLTSIFFLLFKGFLGFRFYPFFNLCLTEFSGKQRHYSKIPMSEPLSLSLDPND